MQGEQAIAERMSETLRSPRAKAWHAATRPRKTRSIVARSLLPAGYAAPMQLLDNEPYLLRHPLKALFSSLDLTFHQAHLLTDLRDLKNHP
jgi:hypothetical protein